jgi:hypothetical protein
LELYFNFLFVRLSATVPPRLGESPKKGHEIHFSSEDSLYRNIFPKRTSPL